MEWIASPDAWIALLSLTVLEIVLGIDNIVFISVLAERLPEEQQERARRIGLALALLGRIVLLLSISWVLGLTATVFSLFGQDVSWRDLILLAGGLFLLAKATHEIHARLEGEEEGHEKKAVVSFGHVITQILLLDLVFSLDSVITAVGMADHVEVMIAAVVIAVIVMIVSVGVVSSFIQRHPTVRMLALSFLLLVGVALVADGLHFHIPRGYIYFAMGFSVLVEILNLQIRDRRKPVDLHERSPGS